MTPETTYLQCWPRGKGYSYRGDLHGPVEQRKLRETSYNGNKPKPWRKGTAEEWRQIRIEEMAERYADRDILCCDSMIVDDLLKRSNESGGDLAEGFSYDEIRNLYADPSDWDLARCHEYADDNGIDMPDPNPWTMDRAAITEALTDASIDCKDDETIETLRDALIVNIDRSEER